MRRIFAIILVYCVISIAAPACAAKINGPSVTEQKLVELSNQFSSIEASWGRFRLGGDFSLVPFTDFSINQNTLPIIEYDQTIDLFLDAAIDQNLQFSLKLTNQRGWGTTYENNGFISLNPLQIDEVFLTMQYPQTFNYLGRFRFSLGAFGIISDFFTNPIEGIAIQHSFGKFQLVAIYNRVNTLYNQLTNLAESGTDYLAGRIGWSNQANIAGINIVPKGLGGERDFSFDWSTSTADYKLAVELGWYSFNSAEYPALDSNPVPGLMVSYGRNLAPYTSGTNYLQLKAGYFAPGFRPSYSSLADVSGDDREWFLPNSQGIEVYWQYQLLNIYQLENRLILLTPVTSPEMGAGYRIRSSITKNITPVNQIQLGFDIKNLNNYFLGQVFAGWMLRF